MILLQENNILQTCRGLNLSVFCGSCIKNISKRWDNLQFVFDVERRLLKISRVYTKPLGNYSHSMRVTQINLKSELCSLRDVKEQIIRIHQTKGLMETRPLISRVLWRYAIPLSPASESL